MNTLFIIQARLTSSRLPNKVLMKFKNKNVIDRILDIIREEDKEQIVLAIPSDELNKQLYEKYYKQIRVFLGEENDVMKRFLNCAEQYNAKNIIRICADNPFLQRDFLYKIYDKLNTTNYDYIAYYKDNINAMQLPIGFFAEGFTYNKLKEVYAKSNDYEKEHVTPIFYMNESVNTKILKLQIPESIINMKYLRFTMDTIDDYKLYKKLIEKYGEKYYNYKELIDILKRDENIYSEMKENYIKGGKNESNKN